MNILSRKHNKGMSLIELMIAMVLGVILLLGATTLFSNNKRVYREVDHMGRLQENARFAMGQLIKDIRMAGYVGCVDNIQYVTNDVNGSGGSTNLLNLSNVIEGSENAANWQGSGSTEVVADMLAGTDGIAIKYFEPSGVFLDSVMPTTSSMTFVSTVTPFSENDILAVSDCESADIFQVTQVITGANSGLQHSPGGSHTPGNDTGDMSKKYGTEAQIMRLVSYRYYIGIGTGGQPALFRYGFISGVEEKQELIEGVENMQILYGVDNTNNQVADSYQTATDVATSGGWGNVVSLRIALLINSIDESGSINNNTYDLLGTTIDPVDDRRRRRVFTSTIQIRNRSS